ncbi:Uma2 family endonuclease [Nonomuraea sp. NPDC049607]|uniref:Uma2 family endonuclease n=1 Tax=Nonomuraea sp. NPDC049607 TaxID=3154732 RepID=UPI0034431C49
MTAEAVILKMESSSSLPDWAFPPPQGYVAEDLDHIPDLPAHTELIDGSLVFVSPQQRFHQNVIFGLHRALADAASDPLQVCQEMTVKLGPKQRPEPDLIVLGPEAPSDEGVTCYQAKDVILAVEVVSPDSEVRDRKRKPTLYAEAGIPHFWRIEKAGALPVVYVYEIDPATGVYVGTGVHHDRLKLTVPFDLDIDLTTLGGRRK